MLYAKCQNCLSFRNLSEANTSLDSTHSRASPTALINETLFDTFNYLSRDDIDWLRFTNRRFRQLVDDCLPTVCLRPLLEASLKGNRRKSPDSFEMVIQRRSVGSSAGETEESDGYDSWPEDEWDDGESRKATKTEDVELVRETFSNQLDALDLLLVRMKSCYVGELYLEMMPVTYDVCRRVAEKGRFLTLVPLVKHARIIVREVLPLQCYIILPILDMAHHTSGLGYRDFGSV